MNRGIRAALLGLGLFVGATFGAVVGFGGGVPPLPVSPTYSEASQIIGTLNAIINQLNGNASGAGGYAAQPGGVVSLGSYCTVSGAVGTLVCTGQRGSISYTSGVTIAGTGSTQTFTTTVAGLTTASNCQAWFGSAFTAGSGVGVATATPTTNTLTVVGVNAGTTSNAVTTATLNFNCIN